MKKINVLVTETVWTYIQKNKKMGETHSDTLERLLGLKEKETVE